MKRLMLAMIRFYRKYISPAFPPSCRFIPTCSPSSGCCGATPLTTAIFTTLCRKTVATHSRF